VPFTKDNHCKLIFSRQCFSIDEVTQLYALCWWKERKNRQKSPFKLKSQVFHVVVDSQAGRYSKKAPAYKKKGGRNDRGITKSFCIFYAPSHVCVLVGRQSPCLRGEGERSGRGIKNNLSIISTSQVLC
jgi:hypothetical protein